MRTRKPRLASGDRVVVDVSTTGNPGLGSASGVVSTGARKEPLPRRATRTILGFGFLSLLMLFLTYVVLATTVFVVMSAEDERVGVLRNTFPIGSAPSGAIVYASSSPVDHSLLGKVEQAVLGVSAGSVVKIVAGPVGVVSTDKTGHITVNGKSTKYTGDVATKTLSREYIAICVAGACKDGAAVIIGQSNIVGEVKGYIGLTGMTDVKAPQ